MNTQAQSILNNGLIPVLLGTSGDGLKVPIQKGWQHKPITSANVAKWGERHNVGIRCGQIANGRFLFVYDFDYEADSTIPQWTRGAGKITDQQLCIVARYRGNTLW